MARKTQSKTEELVIEVLEGRVMLHIIGETPYVFNSMAAKAKRELLFPMGRRSRVARATTLKHDPLQEYRDSMLIVREPAAPTFLAIPSPAFKRALMTAALDLPDVQKAQIGRLVRVYGYRVAFYGIPQLFMASVRSADIAKTPDIRTRAIVPEWCCQITVQYRRPLLTDRNIANLLVAAGSSVGVGDGRIEKGALDFGCFRLCRADDLDYVRLRETAGAEAQRAAYEQPEMFDHETADLYEWFGEELQRRHKAGFAGVTMGSGLVDGHHPENDQEQEV